MSDTGEDGGWRATARYLTYRGMGTAMGRMPEPLAQLVAPAARLARPRHVAPSGTAELDLGARRHQA